MSLNTGTLVGAAIRPIDSTDKIASAYAFEINGGHHSYATISERDAIILERREWGMLCTVYNDTDPLKNGTYQLKYGYKDYTITNNLNWIKFSSGSGGSGGSSYWIDPVLSILEIEPPGLNTNRYIAGLDQSVSLAGTIWASDTTIKGGVVVQWNSTLSNWDKTYPDDGMTVRVLDENNSVYRYKGTFSSTGKWVKENLNQVVVASATSSNGLTYNSTLNGLFSYESNTVYFVQFATANSGISTLNINGLGNVTIKQQTNAGLFDLISKDINPSVIYDLIYDGSYFRLTKPTTDPSLVKTRIFSDENVTIPAYHEYLLYGDLEVDGSLNIDNTGKLVLLNGALNINGGTVSNSGNVQSITVGTVRKYSTVTSIGNTVPATINHNLGSYDITVSLWSEDDSPVTMLQPTSIDILSANSIQVLLPYTVNTCRVVVMG
jgi:hypothetical protein